MQHPSYKITQFASDYQKGNTATQQDFLHIVKKEIVSNLQKYVKKSPEYLEQKIQEYETKILDAIKDGKYDNNDVKKWIANTITPLARSYAHELANNLKEENKKIAELKEVDVKIEVPLIAKKTTPIKGKDSGLEEMIAVRPTPRSYQEQALQKIYAFVDDRKQSSLSAENKKILSAFLLHQTMGTGKTIEIGMFMEWFAKDILPEVFPGEKLRILIVSNKIETIQWQYTTLFHGRDSLGPVFSDDFLQSFYVKEFHSSATRNNQSAIFSKGKKIEDHNMMILSTFQSASDKKIQNIVKKYGQFHIVWIDEGHHLPAPEFNKAATQYIQPHHNGLLPLMPVTTGTSTPALEQLTGSPIFEYELPTYLASQFAPYVEYSMILRPDLSQGDLQAIHENIITNQSEKNIPRKIKNTKNITDDIDRLFVQFNSMDDLVSDISSRIEDLSGTVYFCPSIAFAEELTKTINEQMGSEYYARSYHTGDRYSDAFKSFRNGELAQIVTVDMLNESVHPGNINNIVLLRKTDSFIVYFQQLGRGLTGESVKVLDYVASFKNFITVNDLYNQTEKIRKKTPTDSPKTVKQRFSIVSSSGDKIGVNRASHSMGLDILSIMRKVTELQSGIEHRKATKDHIVQLRKDGVLKDDDMNHHKYAPAAKKINQSYETYGFIVPESINGLISTLGGNISFDTTHEYIMALLQGLEYVRGRQYVTTQVFLSYVKNGTIPMDVLHESKRSDFAAKKNATEELPFLLYSKFRHLCQMIMDIGRKGKYTTEMFHAFVEGEENVSYKPFATVDDYKKLYKQGEITEEVLKYQHWKQFAQEYNRKLDTSCKLHETWGSLRDLCGYNDGKYVQKIIMGDSIKRDPLRNELIDAWKEGVIRLEHLDRKKWPLHAEYLNMKYKDSEKYNFTFPLTFDAFIKIMEELKYKKLKNSSYPKAYIKSLFTGKEYKSPLPKADHNNYIQLTKEGFLSQEQLTPFPWKRFAKTWNKVYGKKYGFALHEAYQSAIATIINTTNKKESSTKEEYDPYLDVFFKENKKDIKKQTVTIQEGLGRGYSAAGVVKLKINELIQEFTARAQQAEESKDWESAFEARGAVKDLNPKDKLYKKKMKDLKKKIS